MAVLADELDRNFLVLKEKADPKPYFMSYEVTETESALVSTNLGAINYSSQSLGRSLDVTVRVGSPKLDNYHRVRGDRVQFTAGVPVPIDESPSALRRRLWLDTDRTYRLAAERLIKVRTNRQVKVKEEDSSDDFSVEEPVVASQPVAHPKISLDEWSTRLRRISGEFSRYPELLSGSATFSAQRDTGYLVNTEGTRISHGRPFLRIVLGANARAADGMDLAVGESFEAVEPADLPDDQRLLETVRRLAVELTAMTKAPTVEPFVGPAILSGRASGVFFHEIFGHRIEGHRQKDESEGQTFTKSVGQAVLPEFLSVIFDPTQRKSGKTDLNGWYLFDDEGVPARRVPVIEHGILKTFLMSRSPIDGFPKSNGHGRRQPGLEVVSRQSNLLVESARKVSDAELRKMLIEEVKKQNKPYGLYFREITGGFTTTSRAGLQAFKVIPLVTYRVYPDGRPDELVRGADIVGTPLASFAKILATSDRAEVFNGFCGAESGSVPVSAVSPAILVSAIEIEKKAKADDRPPLLPAPSDGRQP